MKLVSIIVALIYLGILPAHALVIGGGSYAVSDVKSGDTLKLRSAPTPTSSVVTEIPSTATWIISSGAVVNVNGAAWAQVRYRGAEGWVNSKFLREVKKIEYTIYSLRELGIAIDFKNEELSIERAMPGKVAPYPNACAPHLTDNLGYRISVSPKMLEHFRGRGFTLDTLCLAITTPTMYYNIESGGPLPIVNLGIYRNLLLNIPDCFSRGAPLEDCKVRYHWFWWGKMDRDYAHPISRFLTKVAGRSKEGVHLSTDELRDYPGLSTYDEIFPVSPIGGISVLLVSRAFPKGYAYQLYSGTTAGDDPDEERIQQNSTGKQTVSNSDLAIAAPWNE